MKKRLLSAVLCAAMLVMMIPSAFAASDIEKHWAKTYITYLYSEGVYNPSKTTGKFEPDRQMTRAEFMRYINRAFHFTEKAPISYTDVKSTAWYYETIQIAAKYGYINGVGNNKMNPEGKITREQAAVIIGRLFKADPGNVSPSQLPFKDKSKVASWSAGYIKAAAEKGILSGYSDGSFQPAKVVTRAEVAKILYFYLGTALSSPGKAYTGAELKSDTANVTISENCTLSDAVIEGDLYITEGVGSDAVTLTNVTVNGSIIISGGTVTLVNVTSDHMIVSSPMGRLLQATATGDTRIRNTQVNTAAALYEKGFSAAEKCGFENVSTKGESRVSLTLDGAIDQLSLDSEATVSTTAGTMVYHLITDHAVSVTGYGQVYQADIKVNGVSFAKSVTVSGYTLGDGVTAVIGGQKVETSNAASASPSAITVDLNRLDTLGTAVAVMLPDASAVASVACDGSVLSDALDYLKTDMGIQVKTSFLGTLQRGDHTLLITMKDGTQQSVAVSVVNTAPTADIAALRFDCYYRAADFVDLQLKLNGVSSASDVTGVVLGLSELTYTFNSADRSVVLYRSQLAQLPAGVYTVAVELRDGSRQTANLTVSDSTPDGENSSVVGYNTYAPSDAVITLPLDRAAVRSVSASWKGETQALQSGSDYTVGSRILTLPKVTLEKYRLTKAYVPFTITLSDGSVYTLVVDYVV